MKFAELNDESADSLKDLTVAELKDVCRVCGLTLEVGRNILWIG